MPRTIPYPTMTLVRDKEEFLVRQDKAQMLIDERGYTDPTGGMISTKEREERESAEAEAKSKAKAGGRKPKVDQPEASKPKSEASKPDQPAG